MGVQWAAAPHPRLDCDLLERGGEREREKANERASKRESERVCACVRESVYVWIRIHAVLLVWVDIIVDVFELRLVDSLSNIYIYTCKHIHNIRTHIYIGLYIIYICMYVGLNILPMYTIVCMIVYT